MGVGRLTGDSVALVDYLRNSGAAQVVSSGLESLTEGINRFADEAAGIAAARNEMETWDVGLAPLEAGALSLPPFQNVADFLSPAEYLKLLPAGVGDSLVPLGEVAAQLENPLFDVGTGLSTFSNSFFGEGGIVAGLASGGLLVADLPMPLPKLADLPFPNPNVAMGGGLTEGGALVSEAPMPPPGVARASEKGGALVSDIPGPLPDVAMDPDPQIRTPDEVGFRSLENSVRFLFEADLQTQEGRQTLSIFQNQLHALQNMQTAVNDAVELQQQLRDTRLLR